MLSVRDKDVTETHTKIVENSLFFSILAYIADHIHEQPEVCIKYFVLDEHKSGGAIMEVSGTVKKISSIDGTLFMTDNYKIRLSGITDLSIG